MRGGLSQRSVATVFGVDQVRANAAQGASYHGLFMYHRHLFQFLVIACRCCCCWPHSHSDSN